MRVLLVAASAFTCMAVYAIDRKFTVPLDPEVEYSIIAIDAAGQHRTVTTKRDGEYFTSYAKRELHCSERTVRFLGSSTSLEDLNSADVDRESIEIVKGSIAQIIEKDVCETSVKLAVER